MKSGVIMNLISCLFENWYHSRPWWMFWDHRSGRVGVLICSAIGILVGYIIADLFENWYHLILK